MEIDQDSQEKVAQVSESNKEGKPSSPFKKPVLIGKIGRLPRKITAINNLSENKDVTVDVQGTPIESNKHDSVKHEVHNTTDQKPIKAPAQQLAENATPLPYKEPNWSGLPLSKGKPYGFEVLKNGVIIKEINLMEKPFWVFGRSPNSEIYMTNPTVSRYHAVLQFRKEAADDNPPGFYIYDLNSTHGTFLNKGRLKSRVYAPVKVGHIIKLGFSTCSYILTGPEEDSEEESEFTITELKQQRADKLLQQELAEKEAKLKIEMELEEQRKRDEERGIDWGLSEDADEASDLSENPYAQTNNEELYLDDPKKALRGFFEREGHDLEYDCSEQGFGQFLCKVELPVDDDHGRPIIAEVLHKGKKKEAVIQCALEACRILDRYGVLRKATHESRKRKAKNWEENDYYDSDDDTFLDRTGTIEKKREKRMHAKVPQQPETYQSLLEKEKKVSEKILAIESQLSKAKSASLNDFSNAEEDSLDSYMKELKDSKLDKQTISKLKSELAVLKVEQINIVKLVNLAKPADLPPLVINNKSVGDQQGTSGIAKGKALPLFGKRPKIKLQLPTKPTTESTAEKMEADKEEEEEDEEEIENQANTSKATENSNNIDTNPQGRSNDRIQSPENSSGLNTNNKKGSVIPCHIKVQLKITELEKLLTDTKFPPSLENYVTEIEDVLDNVKDLMESEGRIQSDKKTIMAKNRKVRKHIDNLIENFDENHLVRICKECRRIFVDIQEIAVEQHRIYSKIRILGMKIDLLCKAILKKIDEVKKKSKEERTSVPDDMPQDDNSDEEDNKHLTPEELEKRRKRNQRRLLHRKERAEIEKQKGYQEDARKQDYNMWVPPQNQTGDGRTSLNEKFGY